MGKTQLVLHYIEKHEARYNTIFWIDVRSEKTARSSYERCCRVLGLPVDPSSDNKLLQDTPYVQAVLTWLRAQTDDDKWLTIVDNADDLTWDVSSIVPKGKAGTVIVTSQDAHASRRLLGGRSPTVKVDAMTSEEATSLLTNHFDEAVYRGSDCWNLVEEITGCLDRLALPMDLAGARISVDVENWGDLDAALRQYLSDYRRNQDELLQDAEFATAGSYNKTVRTAWETSLSSLRKMEHDQSAIYPIKLLSFLALFDRTNVQDELFRLASKELEIVCDWLETTVPPWLRELLDKDDDGEWKSSLYRATVNALLRYGLVKSIGEPWMGVTMHGLVQRRARQDLSHGYWLWHMVILYASCICIYDRLHGSDDLRFRRHLVLHFPSNDELLRDQPHAQPDIQLGRIWERISLIYVHEGRLKEAVQLQSYVLELRKGIYGENDPRTLHTMSTLARLFSSQELWEKATELNSRVIQTRESQLGAKHSLTLESRHHGAVIMAEGGRWNDSMAEILAVLEIRREILGDHHVDTLDTVTNLAATYTRQGMWTKAQELLLPVFEAQKKSLERHNPFFLAESMSNLAYMYSQQGKLREAEQLQVEVLEILTDLYGRDHYETIRSRKVLSGMYSEHGKHEEAKHLRAENLEISSRLLGPEHIETLKAMTSLIATLLDQERWKDAYELAVKTSEVSSRTLGQNHDLTLGAMVDLAWAAKGLGQNDHAIDLMRRTAAISATVRDHDHPYCQRLREIAEEWSAIQDGNVEEVSGGSHEETN